MNKYAFAIFSRLNGMVDERKNISFFSKIYGLFDENFTKDSWAMFLMEIELVYGVEIPDDLATKTFDLTILEFGKMLSNLPQIPEIVYPEFYEIKMTFLKYIPQLIQKQNNGEDVEELQKIICFANDRLKIITLPLSTQIQNFTAHRFWGGVSETTQFN